jgi:competence protein ComEA
VKRALLVWLLASATSALAVEANSANRAQLEQLRHVGPPLAEAILVARDKDGAFKDWPDLMSRVRGIRSAKAGKLSEAGLTVGGAPYAAPPK